MPDPIRFDLEQLATQLAGHCLERLPVIYGPASLGGHLSSGPDALAEVAHAIIEARRIASTYLCEQANRAHEASEEPDTERVPLERCTGDTPECPHYDCPDGWHDSDDLPCGCTPDCALTEDEEGEDDEPGGDRGGEGSGSSEGLCEQDGPCPDDPEGVHHIGCGC